MPTPTLQLPPNAIPLAELGASKQKPVYISVAIGLVLATASVLLRCIARRMSKAVIGWDDYTIFCALLLLYGLGTSILLSVKYGLGRHFPIVASTVIPFQKASLGILTLWLATAAATKASLLLLYYRLFSVSKGFRLAVRIGAAVVFCQWFSLTIVTIFQCIPVGAFWDRNIQNARCLDLPRVTITSGVMNLLTDVLILCLPVPVVWGLHTNVAQKITVTGMFLLGIFVCAISIVRISKVAVIGSYHVGQPFDPTWDTVEVNVWTSLEDAVGITSACLPTMGPLFRHFSSLASRFRSSSQKNRPNSQHLAKNQFRRLSGELGPDLELQGNSSVQKSFDRVTSNGCFSTNKAPLRPLHSVNSTSRLEDQQDLRDSTRRAGFE